jgi:hypothetical protein
LPALKIIIPAGSGNLRNLEGVIFEKRKYFRELSGLWGVWGIILMKLSRPPVNFNFAGPLKEK